MTDHAHTRRAAYHIEWHGCYTQTETYTHFTIVYINNNHFWQQCNRVVHLHVNRIKSSAGFGSHSIRICSGDHASSLSSSHPLFVYQILFCLLILGTFFSWHFGKHWRMAKPKANWNYPTLISPSYILIILLFSAFVRFVWILSDLTTHINMSHFWQLINDFCVFKGF